MGFLLALSVVLAVTASGTTGSPWNHLDEYLHLPRDVDASSSLSSTNSSDAVVSTTIPASTSTSTTSSEVLPPDASTSTITQLSNDECSGTVTFSGNAPLVGTVTITETVTADPSVALPPPTFITPIQPCETELVSPPQAPCPPPCMTVPKFTPMASSIIQITKKTTVHERPVMTDPPLFDSEITGQPQHSATIPPVSGIDIDQVISDILDDHASPHGPGATPTDLPPPSPSLLSTITSPPDATNAVTAAEIPITVADGSVVMIGTHSITFTRNPGNTNVNSGVLGPTTTLTVSGQLITVAPPVLIFPSTTFVVNPSLLTSERSPSPTTGPVSASGGESTGDAGQADATTTSSSAGSLNRVPRIKFDILNVGALTVTATIVMIMGGV